MRYETLLRNSLTFDGETIRDLIIRTCKPETRIVLISNSTPIRYFQSTILVSGLHSSIVSISFTSVEEEIDFMIQYSEIDPSFLDLPADKLQDTNYCSYSVRHILNYNLYDLHVRMTRLASLIAENQLDEIDHDAQDTIRDVLNRNLDVFSPIWIVDKPSNYENDPHSFYRRFINSFKSVRSTQFISDIPGVGLVVSPMFHDVNEGLNSSLIRMNLNPSILDVKFNQSNVDRIQHILVGLLSSIEQE